MLTQDVEYRPWNDCVPRRRSPATYLRIIRAIRQVNELVSFCFGPDAQDIADWLDMPKSTVWTYLKDMEGAGWIEQFDGRDKWRVTASGRLREAELELAAIKS